MASPFVTGKGMSHFPNGQSMAMLDMCGESYLSTDSHVGMNYTQNAALSTVTSG